MDIEQQWQELLDALKLRAKKLSQAINLTNYLRKSKEILYWIEDKASLQANALRTCKTVIVQDFSFRKKKQLEKVKLYSDLSFC